MGEKCDYVAQTQGVLCSHVHRVHLGIALGCSSAQRSIGGKHVTGQNIWTKLTPMSQNS